MKLQVAWGYCFFAFIDLNIFNFKWIIRYVFIKHVCLFTFLYLFYNVIGKWQGYNFIGGFQCCLRQNKQDQLMPWNNTRECNGKENQRISSFAHYGRSHSTYGEVPSALHDFHFTHHIRIQERSEQERYKAGYRYPFRVMQDKLKSLLIREIVRSRCPDTDTENQYNKEIHHEPAPDNQPHLPVAPHFGYQVINNVRDGENE